MFFSSGVGLVDRSSPKTQRSGYEKVGTKQPSANGLNFFLRQVRTGCLVPTSKTVMLCECPLQFTCAGSAVAPRAPARASAAPRASPIARTPALRARFYAVQRRPRGLQRPCWREALGEGRGTGSFPNVFPQRHQDGDCQVTSGPTPISQRTAMSTLKTFWQQIPRA